MYLRRINRGFGKKGNAITDTLFICLILGAFAIIVIFLKDVVNIFSDEVVTIENGFNQSNVDIMNNSQAWYSELMDGLVIFLVIGFLAASLIFAYRINASPAFYMIAFSALVVVFFIAMVMSNVYDDVTSSTTGISTIAEDDYPITNTLMDNWFPVMLIVGFLIMLVLYIRPGSSI